MEGFPWTPTPRCIMRAGLQGGKTTASPTLLLPRRRGGRMRARRGRMAGNSIRLRMVDLTASTKARTGVTVVAGYRSSRRQHTGGNYRREKKKMMKVGKL